MIWAAIRSRPRPPRAASALPCAPPANLPWACADGAPGRKHTLANADERYSWMRADLGYGKVAVLRLLVEHEVVDGRAAEIDAPARLASVIARRRVVRLPALSQH